jgi:hypothetical protein
MWVTPRSRASFSVMLREMFLIKPLGRPVEARYGVLGPGELPGATLGDERAGLLEGAVVYGAGGRRSSPDLLLAWLTGAAAAGP